MLLEAYWGQAVEQSCLGYMIAERKGGVVVGGRGGRAEGGGERKMSSVQKRINTEVRVPGRLGYDGAFYLSNSAAQ